MNRLEDELRLALRPEEPPEGFAERIVELLGEIPERKRGFIEDIIEALRPPKVRFALATSFLIVLIGLAIYYGVGHNRPPATDQVAKQDVVKDPAPESQAGIPSPPKVPSGNDRHKLHRPGVRPVRTAAKRPHTQEGEEARERLLLALQIASSTLSEARDAVSQSLSARRAAH
ncbi:MAG TPA: hypothetical protein VFV34_23105 [Blastocatellia bacterium]|nr:hypothetical protein [Blastocatellia bacterium]